MNNLLKKYLNSLKIEQLKEFSLKNDINLTNEELCFILDLVKNNLDDILVNDSKYLEIVKNKIDSENYKKIEKLFIYYKNRYKGYLF